MSTEDREKLEAELREIDEAIEDAHFERKSGAKLKELHLRKQRIEEQLKQ